MSIVNNKKLLTTGSVMVALSAFVPNHHEALANTASFSPSATVVDPITLAVSQELQFGKLAQNGAGQLRIGTTGAQTQTGSVQALGGTHQEGKLAITGPANTSLVLSVVGLAAGIDLKTGSNSKTMTITRFDFEDPGANVVSPAGTFNLKTSDTTTAFKFDVGDTTTNLSFGARLAASGDEVTATYTGSFVMSLTFP